MPRRTSCQNCGNRRSLAAVSAWLLLEPACRPAARRAALSRATERRVYIRVHPRRSCAGVSPRAKRFRARRADRPPRSCGDTWQGQARDRGQGVVSHALCTAPMPRWHAGRDLRACRGTSSRHTLRRRRRASRRGTRRAASSSAHVDGRRGATSRCSPRGRCAYVRVEGVTARRPLWKRACTRGDPAR